MIKKEWLWIDNYTNKNKMTQTQKILEYLNEYKQITPLEAMRDLGIYRLASRIFDLKEQGYNIHTEMVDVKNRYGTTTKVASYSIK
ncbi:MAG: hypothetical protein Tp172MES00d2C118481931_9 [Prokaryotic dsDNA virus sp.]|nr:MAG: hypothetical protein Tp172MES00d2C118481931_9 [Prokaryotic dsDNA virus sp.]|tara:strand:- start:4114 stop:4371 length:258 start_codon:yes stop_codon:yes gene_type:complete